VRLIHPMTVTGEQSREKLGIRGHIVSDDDGARDF
jgi:hypothetical protein